MPKKPKIRTMRTEVKKAVSFLITMMAVRLEKREELSIILERMMLSKFRGFWFEDNRKRASGYRCILVTHIMDPMLREALIEANLPYEVSDYTIFNGDFSLWCDPGKVQYRIGKNGSVGTAWERT